MGMRLAEVRNGVVVNVIEADAGAVPAWAEHWPEAGDAGPGWLQIGDDLVAPPLVEDLPALRVEAKAAAVATIEARQAQITDGVPKAEMASWSLKADRAAAWLADTSKPVPMVIAAEAQRNGKTPVQVATRIRDKAQAWEAVIGAHTAYRQNAFEAIEASSSGAEIGAALAALRAALA